MKWTRVEAGEYSAMNGTYMVKGSGIEWSLFYDGEELNTFAGKKYAQMAAEKHLEDNGEPQRETEEEEEIELNTEVPPPSNLEGTDLEHKLVQLHLDVSSAHFEMVAMREEIKAFRKELKVASKQLEALYELIDNEFELDDEDEDEEEED